MSKFEVKRCLEDGRTVCHACCVGDLEIIIDRAIILNKEFKSMLNYHYLT